VGNARRRCESDFAHADEGVTKGGARPALPKGSIAIGPLALIGAARYRCRLSGTAVCIPMEFGPRAH